jgi:O-antigen/teichoic acid export membrane protein
MSVAFVPLYVRYLGVEAFGLIGLYTMLQGWLGILDLGLRPMLAREMARFSGGAMDSDSIRDILRTVEMFVVPVCIAMALGVWAVSGWIAVHWVKAEALPLATLSASIGLMGLVVGLRILEGLYQGCLAGLQQQVAENTITIMASTGRGFGALVVLVAVSPSIEAFFIWQVMVSSAAVLMMATTVYRQLGPKERAARPSLATLKYSWRFASGMMMITLLSILITQIDKIILSRAVTLREFGYYSLAFAVAATVGTLSAPITTAFAPRFTQLVAKGDDTALRQNYHAATQYVCVLSASAMALFLYFGRPLLVVWTGDATLAQQVAPVLAILGAAAFFQSVLTPPYFLQLAYGWTRLAIGINIVALTIVTPALLWAVPLYGAIGAATAWLSVTAFYLFVSIYLMHRRILRGELVSWYAFDVAIPAICALCAAAGCAIIFPSTADRLTQLFALCVTGATVSLSAIAGSGVLRRTIVEAHARFRR